MTIVRLDFARGESEILTPEETELRRIQARLRDLAVKINEAPEGEEKAELRQRYRALVTRLRELGGDADVKESYPGDELSEEAAVDGIVADFAGSGAAHDAVDLSEPGDRPEEPTGSYFGTDEFMRMAQEPDAPPSDDQALHDALRAQAEADSFGDDPPDVSDDELWGAFRDSWGIEEDGR
jgi:hypothetical protein